MSKVRMATVWLGGCSGCHMSFLDLDERLIELADKVELVYSPLVDAKEFPESVDVTLVEGAVTSEEQWEQLRMIRERTRILVALGDCAVTGNVTAMRNPLGSAEPALQRAYVENATAQAQIPQGDVPRLLPRVYPLAHVVRVDAFIPGCPPSADLIYDALSQLLAGRLPDLTGRGRFG